MCLIPNLVASEFPLTESADQQRVAVRSVKTQDVYRNLARGRIPLSPAIFQQLQKDE
jgi:hypothetical protein